MVFLILSVWDILRDLPLCGVDDRKISVGLFRCVGNVGQVKAVGLGNGLVIEAGTADNKDFLVGTTGTERVV